MIKEKVLRMEKEIKELEEVETVYDKLSKLEVQKGKTLGSMPEELFLEMLKSSLLIKFSNSRDWYRLQKLKSELKGFKNALAEVGKVIDEMENPYPEDIFPKLHEELLEEINQELQNKFEFPLDRLSAHIGRKIRENVKEELKQKLGIKEHKK